MVEPTTPVDQFTVPGQPAAVSVVATPGLTTAAEAVSVGAEGIGLTVTTTLPTDDTQPLFEQVAV